MSTDDPPAPVTGEIIPRDESATHSQCAGGAEDILDAEYETVDEQPQQQGGACKPASATRAPAGLDILQRSATPARDHSERSGGLLWAAGLAAMVCGFWISGGHTLFDRAGAATPAIAAEMLHIQKLESRLEPSGRGLMLTVSGDARNSGNASHRLPDLSINVLDMDGRTAHYFLGTNGRSLAPGDRFSFSSRLAAPKAGVKSVSVSFVE